MLNNAFLFLQELSLYRKKRTQSKLEINPLSITKRVGTVWHICIVRQASGASLTSNGKDPFKKTDKKNINK